MFDKHIIESLNDWLTDTIINATQYLLEVRFPDIKGFQNVLLNQIQEFVEIDKGKTFVQILNDGEQHWLVLSNAKVDDKDRKCRIYDSKGLTNPMNSKDEI